MVIRILDYVSTPSSYKDGEVIYKLIRQEFGSGRKVVLSFDGIGSIPSAFVNAALIKLLEEFSFVFIRSNLDIVKSTRQINRLIKDRFLFAANEKTSP